MKLGQLEVEITANDTNLRRGLKRVDGSIAKTAKRVGALAAGFAKFAAVGVAAASAVGIALVRSQLQQIDALAKTSALLNVTIQDLQGLRFAAEQSGASAGVLDKALERLTRNIGEVQGGTGEAKKAFDELGLSAVELAKISPADALGKVATALQGVESNSQRVNFAYQILGRSGTQLVNMLANGEEGLNAFKQEALDLGLTLDEVDAAKVEAANDALNRIQKVIQGALQQATVELAPFIEAIAKEFANAAKESGGMGHVVVGVMEDVGRAISKVANTFTMISKAFKYIELAASTWFKFVTYIMKETATAIEDLLSGIINSVNVVISAMNKIPKIDIGLIDPNVSIGADTLTHAFDGASESVNRIKQEIEGLANAEPLGDKVAKWAAGVRETLNEPIVVTPGAELNEEGGPDRTGVNDASLEQLRQLGKSKLQLIQEQEDERLALLSALNTEELELIGGFEAAKKAIQGDANEQRLLETQVDQAGLEDLIALGESELEIIQKQETARLELLKSMSDLELEQVGGFEAAKTAIEKDAAKQREEIAEEEQMSKLRAVGGAFNNLASLMNTGSRKLFKIGKMAAKAGAIVDGFAAVQGAIKAGNKVGGPIVGAAFGAAAAIQTAVQIRQINQSQFGGGGGGASSFSGGLPAIRTQEQAQPAPSRNVSINLQGSNFSAEQVRTLIGQINEQIGDGVPVMIGAR